MKFTEIFMKLNSIDVSGHIEKKKDLSYLSWSWAFAEVSKLYDWDYEVVKDTNGNPFFNTPYGAYVETIVTIEGVKRGMRLPVMDGSNKAMRDTPYEYATKYEKKRVNAFDMMDINKSIMRCVVKNLAIFGLGLYIYSGEDLPEDLGDGTKDDGDNKKPQATTNTNAKQAKSEAKATSASTKQAKSEAKPSNTNGGNNLKPSATTQSAKKPEVVEFDEDNPF